MAVDASLDRVAIVGTSGSGKTTLARRLARRLGVPHIELDSIYWLPGWAARPRAEFRALTAQAVAAPAWTLDGNYSEVRDIVWARATHLVWLKYPFRIVFGRVLWRTVRRALTQEPLFGDNRESLRLAFFSRDSLLLWVLNTYGRHRREYPELFRQWPHLSVTELSSQREADAWFESI